MEKIMNKVTYLASAAHSVKARMIVLALVIALFILAAGAPNATIGIGK